VIADNCTDQTATLAAAAGARVVERFNQQKKSKGFAIEYLIAQLQESAEFDQLDALVIVDADTTIDPDLLTHFDRRVRNGTDWIQAYYTVANPDDTWRTRLMTYAFSLFNGVLLLGLNGLGASAGFKGNGMCFTTRGLRRVPWACYGLVEDMEFSWVLRVAGESIAFDPDVKVHGAMVKSGGEAAANQRRRWEFGRSEIRRKYLGPVLSSTKLTIKDRILLATELTLPTMSSLVLILAAALLFNSALFAWSLWNEQVLVPAALLVLSIVITVAMAMYMMSPFLAMRLPWYYWKTLLFAPVYLIWKLAISKAGRPQQWIRTARETAAKRS
jgi:cellulose synthase/poly-beta-1,6-N-acetylglucosamine synthase-like glycosyltransferase